MELLLEAQADLTATDGDGDTALDNAWKAGRSDVVEAIQREERRRNVLRDGEEKARAAEAAAAAGASVREASHGGDKGEVAAEEEEEDSVHPSLNACRRAAIAVSNESEEAAEAWLDEHIDDDGQSPYSDHIYTHEGALCYLPFATLLCYPWICYPYPCVPPLPPFRLLVHRH